MDKFPSRNRRILLIDDNPAIHEDYLKVLCESKESNEELHNDDEFLFGGESKRPEIVNEIYEADSAYQGAEGLEFVEQSVMSGNRYAVAIVDMRMPPGWDGVETVKRLWIADPQLLVIFCTAFSDYSLSQIAQELGRTNNFVMLKKPFDNVEIIQLVGAMTERWQDARNAEENISEIARLKERERQLEQSVANMEQRLTRLMNTVSAGGDNLPMTERPRVLLCDENSSHSSPVHQSLHSIRAEVTDLHDPSDVINEFLMSRDSGDEYGLIIIDPALQSGDGYSCCRKLRELGYQGALVAYSSHDRPGDRLASNSAGCDDHLSKSACEAEITAALIIQLNRNTTVKI